VGSVVAATRMASAERGTFIQNAQRQPTVSVKKPPKRGPATVGTAYAMPMMLRYHARLRGGTTSATMACERIMRPPPPRPCMALPTMSPAMAAARAQATEPTANRTSAPRKRPLRPMRSPSLP